MAQETIVGYLDGIESSGSKVTYKVKRDKERKFPDWYIGWFPAKDAPDAAPPPLFAGRWYKFICDIRMVGDKKYYNFASVAPADAPTPALPPKAPPTPPPPQTAATPQEQASQQASAPFVDDRTRTMVLAYAKDLTMAHMAQGNPLSLVWLANRYQALLELLSTGEIRQLPDEEHEADVRAHLLKAQREATE